MIREKNSDKIQDFAADVIDLRHIVVDETAT